VHNLNVTAVKCLICINRQYPQNCIEFDIQQHHVNIYLNTTICLLKCSLYKSVCPNKFNQNATYFKYRNYTTNGQNVFFTNKNLKNVISELCINSSHDWRRQRSSAASKSSTRKHNDKHMSHKLNRIKLSRKHNVKQKNEQKST